MPRKKGEIEQETQHERRKSATKEADIDTSDAEDDDIPPETQHVKREAAKDPSKREDDDSSS